MKGSDEMTSMAICSFYYPFKLRKMKLSWVPLGPRINVLFFAKKKKGGGVNSTSPLINPPRVVVLFFFNDLSILYSLSAYFKFCKEFPFAYVETKY